MDATGAAKNMQVNFILTSGPLTPEYCRAIRSAKVHGAPIVLWHCGPRPDVTGLDVHLAPIAIPDWLHPQNQCHIYDVLAYHIAYVHGGMVLGIDTISVRPAWDLLGDADVVLSRDWPATRVGDVEGNAANLAYPYNNNFIAKQGSDGALALFTEAKRRIINDPEIWGTTGPWMLSQFVDGKRIIGAPFPALCGWAPGYVWRFYLGLETPGPDVRVIHLCSSAYRALYERRYDDWARENPAYAGLVARRTDANDLLLTGRQ